MALDFGILGPLQMTANGAPLVLGTPKQRAVLAMLVMSRNRAVSSESLVNAAWEQFPPPEPKASLHSYISNLRRLIAAAGLDAKSVLASAPPGYRLAVADADCDIGRFVAHKNAAYRQPRRDSSNRPAGTSRTPWPSGADPSSTTYATSSSSRPSPRL